MSDYVSECRGAGLEMIDNERGHGAVIHIISDHKATKRKGG